MRLTELGKSRIANTIFAPTGYLMRSQLRRIFHNPDILVGSTPVSNGDVVLEVGCAMGFFTCAIAQLVGQQGRVHSIDALSGFVDALSKDLALRKITNVSVTQQDATDTDFPADHFDAAIVFGVVPSFTLPLPGLLRELHRVIKPNGSVSFWMFPFAAGVPSAIEKSGMFQRCQIQNRVFTYTVTKKIVM